MPYCLNPACPHPENPDHSSHDLSVCQTCGTALYLGDRYTAVSLLGQGGFGRTFLAVDHQQARGFCVIKQFFPQFPDQQELHGFRQEATRLGELGHHPQIPALLDYLEEAGRPYLVQEFIQGQTLAQQVVADGPLTEAQVLSVLGDILPVLQFIHDRQVIHRDIKPENIIRPRQTGQEGEGGPSLVLVDFGASKYLGGITQKQTGTVIGSAGYAAPEQTMGKAEFASDLYSLGATCIHLLTGLHPFDLYSVSEDAWIWQTYLKRPLSRGLSRLLEQLLQRATAKRYARAIAVLNDLKQVDRVGRQPYRGLTILEDGPENPSAPQEESSSSLWQERATLVGHDGPVTAIALSADNRYFASASDDRSINWWERATGRVVKTFEGRSLWFGQGHSDRIVTLSLNPLDETLLSGGEDGTIKQWDLTEGRLRRTLQSQGWMVSALAVSKDGHQLVSGNGDGSIDLWDLRQGTVQGRRTRHHDRISALLLSPDDQTLISASYDKTICIWNFQTGELLRTLRGHQDSVTAIVPSPDWRLLVSAGWDGHLRVWDRLEGNLIWSLQAHQQRIHCLALSPDGAYLASGGEDHCLKLWPIQQGDRPSLPPRKQRPLLRSHGWGINALCFTRDSQQLMSGGMDGTIKVWQHWS